MNYLRRLGPILLFCFAAFFASAEIAQAQSTAQSKDYWVSFLPSKRNSAAIWVLMCTNVPNTKVTVYYSDDKAIKDEFTIEPNMPKEYKVINKNGYLAKPTAEERVENRSMHVVASNPISLQGLTDEDNNVGLFLILPTSSLGQSYVVSAYNDQPFISGNCLNCFDSTSGAFVVTAVEDNTNVTITAHSPTKSHRAGETWTVGLSQGQTYWVQGAAKDDQDDLSQSTVVSDKPVAVIAGCEIMRALDAMVIQGHFDYNDYTVEQMIPVETWGTDYVSAPFTNKRGTKLDYAGDLYRVYAKEPTTITFNGRVQNVGTYWEFPLTTDPVHITSDKPIMVVQYDYYVDFHFANTPRTSNSEMVLVPRHNWRKNATFKVPTGYALTYFAIVAQKDSVDNIQVSVGGAPPHSVGSLPPGLKYRVDDYAVRVVQLDEPKQVIVSGKCDFAVYNYGTRDNDQIKATYGYAAAAAASFGSISDAKPPRMKFDSTCTTFNVTLYDSSIDGRGIGEMSLLYDPTGLIYRGKPFVSTNVTLVVDPYDLGSKSATAHITVNNALLDAFAALYVTDRAGKDTVYTFRYSGVKVAATPGTQLMAEVRYGTGKCVDYKMTNNSKLALPIKGVSLESISNGQTSAFTLTTTPALPAILKPNDFVTIHVCYTATDTGRINTHKDSIQVVTDCYAANLAEVNGSGAVPLIYSNDVNFGNVVVGTTKCKDVTITDVSPNQDLILTKDVLFNSPVFSLDAATLAKMPITLHPGQFITVSACYTPDKAGTDSTIATWGNETPMPYTHTVRDISILRGSAVKAGVNFGLNAGSANTVCVRDTIFTIPLANTGDATGLVDSVVMGGTDAAEFTILKVGSQNTWNAPFDIAAKTSIDVQVQFVANTTGPNAWRTRRANLFVYSNQAKDTSTVKFTADVAHPFIASNVASLSFAEADPNVAQTLNLSIDNKQGTSPLTIVDFTTSDPTFTVTSGLTKGQVLQPGDVVPVTVQAVNAVAGAYNGTLTILTAECGGNLNLPLHALYASRAVSATGAVYDTTWTCESNLRHVEFCNRGSKPVLLRSAVIASDVFNTDPAVNANEFIFGDIGSLGTLLSDSSLKVKTGGIWLPKDSCIDIPVLYNPTLTGLARAVVNFTYDSGDGRQLIVARQIIANGKVLPVEVTTMNVTNTAYTAQVDQSVDVPITVKQDLGVGDIYGYGVDVVFNSDMFNFNSMQVTPGDNGYPVVATKSVTKSNDTNYLTVNIRGSGPVKIGDGQKTLAHVNMISRLTKSDTTSIIPMNLTFFRKDGSSICYTPTSHDPSVYVQQLRCGEKTIQGYIRDNGSVVHLLGTTPNPSSGPTSIRFEVRGTDVPVTIEIYNMLGINVATLADNAIHNSGIYEMHFDASQFTSGAYYCRITGGLPSQTWTESSRISIQK
jgi:hypothetical protein